MKQSPRPREKDAPARGKAMYALMHAARAIESRMEESLGEVGLSGAKFSALSRLAEAEGQLTLTELAAKLTCVRSNITQLVDRLEADGLVRRVEDATDRRSIRAALTPLGWERQSAGAERVDALERGIEKALSDVDAAQLQRALLKLG